MKHTDTERLDWLIAHSHCKVAGSSKNGYIVWDTSNGLCALTGVDTEGHPIPQKTSREAIDLAMERHDSAFPPRQE